VVLAVESQTFGRYFSARFIYWTFARSLMSNRKFSQTAGFVLYHGWILAMEQAQARLSKLATGSML
jgi:hypothetical protein